ncbi:MAG: hypothetical protein ACTS6J_17215, partial [Burkholderiales bacterium]
WIEEVPGVNCQERTRDELLKALRVTLMQALEMNRTDARDAAGKGYEVYCGMKRRDLLRHFSSHGCTLLRSVAKGCQHR